MSSGRPRYPVRPSAAIQRPATPADAAATAAAGSQGTGSARQAAQHPHPDTEPLVPNPTGTGSAPPSDDTSRGKGDTERSVLAELRELCEAALLAPMDSPLSSPLAALEPRGDRPSRPREPRTAAHLADEVVRCLQAMPQVRARVVARLAEREAPTPEPTSNDARAAMKELRAAHNLLDNLGCPRSEDDRPLPVLERMRWLLDVLTASQAARDAERGPRLPLGDTTPATGRRILPADPGRPA